MKVAVVAPSRTLPQVAADKLFDLGTAEIEFHVHPQCFLEQGHFAGSDDERAKAFIEVANDPSFDAVWLARGGYGACRILDRVLPELGPASRGKHYLGYSDGGYLLAALASRGVGRSVHAPMVADGLREGGAAALQRVAGWLRSDSEGVEPSCDHEGAFAFNLAVLSSLVSGPYLPSLEGRVLMIEEVDEHLYAIDRVLFTAFASGRLAGLKGLRLGRVSMVPENDVPFGEEPEAMVARWCSAYAIPYLGRAEIGHDANNRIVPFPKA